MNSAAHRIAAYVTFTVALAGGSACAADPGADESDTTENGVRAGSSDTTAPVEATDAQRKDIAQKKATCPFVGAMVYLKKLPILNSLGRPLAKIEDVEKIGNESGGNLGRFVLKAFATGNHHRMATGETVPDGTFSLDFPPAQGAHPGHSGILIGGKRGQYVGRFDEAAWGRFAAQAVDHQGQKVVKRSEIGAYIWESVKRDPESKYLGHGLALSLADDVIDLIVNPSAEKIIKLTGTDHIVGSAGEWALLMVMLEVPNTTVDGEPVVRLSDVEMMFRDKQMPEGWNTRPLEATAWVKHTSAILKGAECEGRRIPSHFCR